MDARSEAGSPLVEHLFRHESGRMLAALVRVVGVHNFDLAEDIVQETLVRALETWRYGRAPPNPGAWLMLTAKNGALDAVRRERSARRFAPDLRYQLDSEWTLVPTLDGLFLDSEIRDDQLRMMFSCCHPRLAPEVQVALVLKILCGFSTGELARAFFVEDGAMEKRITRGKQALRDDGALYELTADAIPARLGAVLDTLYLLFNEGYHGSHAELPIRAELCEEAVRLLALLLEHRAAATPRAQALLALMCFHAARLRSRLSEVGSLVSLEDQDRGRWDAGLIRRGAELLEHAASGEALSEFHLEAAIAAKHCLAPRFADTDWTSIVTLYDLLLRLKATPIVALNRAIAISQVEGPEAGLAALHAIAAEGLEGYPFFAAAMGEMHRRAGRLATAAELYRAAIDQARSPAEAQALRLRLTLCTPDAP